MNSFPGRFYSATRRRPARKFRRTAPGWPILAPVNDVLNVWVGTIGQDDYTPVTRDEERGIRIYAWAAGNEHILYLQDAAGNENWRLYATNLASGETRDLTPFEDVQAQVVDRNKHFPNELLIGMNKDNPQVHDVYHLDLPSDELTLVAKNPGNIIGWETDANFKVRCAVTALPDGGRGLLYREDEQAEWKELLVWEGDDGLNSYPLNFSLDGQSLYLVDSRNANASRLVKMDIASGAITVIAEDPHFDVDSVMVHPDTYEIQAVAFNKDRVEWTVLDQSIKVDFDTMRDYHLKPTNLPSLAAQEKKASRRKLLNEVRAR